jgi:large subunit ribosomal protein L18
MDKKNTRLRRAAKTRRKIKELCMPRLSVHRSVSHLYVQLIQDSKSKVLASASTLDPAIKELGIKANNVKAATAVGKLIAERVLTTGVKEVAFDKSGYKYHGRIKALADAARENGLIF